MAGTDAPEKWRCEAISAGRKHTFTVTVQAGKPEGFFYGSVDQRGHTCGLKASRRQPGSKWLDGVAGAPSLVTLMAGGDVVGEVSLQSQGKAYRLEIRSPLDAGLCGEGASIASSVEIRAGQKQCVLGRAAR